MAFNLQIITPEATVFEGSVDSMTLPGTAGSMGILDRHAQMLAALDIGILKYMLSGMPHYLVIGNGMLTIISGNAVVMAEIVMTAEDLSDAEEKLDMLKKEQQSLFIAG